MKKRNLVSRGRKVCNDDPLTLLSIRPPIHSKDIVFTPTTQKKKVKDRLTSITELTIVTLRKVLSSYSRCLHYNWNKRSGSGRGTLSKSFSSLVPTNFFKIFNYRDCDTWYSYFSLSNDYFRDKGDCLLYLYLMGESDLFYSLIHSFDLW